MGKRLAPHFAAHVKTDEVHVVPTAAGAFPQNVEVFVERGGELPDNLADGEEDRLKRLGAFTPLPPYAERVRAQGARLVADAAAEGEASEKPGLVIPDVDEDDLPPPLPDGSVGPDGRVSADVAHNTAPAGEAVQPPRDFEEHAASVQAEVNPDAAPSHESRARRASKSK